MTWSIFLMSAILFKSGSLQCRNISWILVLNNYYMCQGAIQVLRQQRGGWVGIAKYWRFLTKWVGGSGKNIKRKNFIACLEFSFSELFLCVPFLWAVFFQTRPYLLKKKNINGWVGMYKKMLTSSDKVCGSKKVKKMLT